MIIRLQANAVNQVGGEHAVAELLRLATQGLTPPRRSKHGPIETYTFQWLPIMDVDGILISTAHIRGVDIAVMRGKVSGKWWAKFASNEVQTYLGQHDTIEQARQVAESFASKHIPILPPGDSA